MQTLDRQDGIISTWQMIGAGMSRAAVRWHTADMARLHPGVYRAGHGRLTDRQRWWAAVATAPATALSHTSAARCQAYGDDRHAELFVTVTRPGGSPRRRTGGVLVSHASDLHREDLTAHQGIPIVSASRTICDLAGHVDREVLGKLVREALRTGAADGTGLARACERAKGRRGIPVLRELLLLYVVEHARRTRSDAEILALAVLRLAGVGLPEVNVVRAGYEADLSWPEHRVIVELDGGSFHLFESEDARRDAAWTRAGWTVNRVSTSRVYDDPHRFVSFVRAALGKRPN